MQHQTAMQLYNLHEELYSLVEKINDEQKIIKDNDPVIKTNKSKKIVADYNTKLEELRSTLLATKQKSIFADEEKLREQISDVYSVVCYQEARPTNLQIERITGLEEEVKKATKAYESLNSKYAAQVKQTIEAERKISNSGTSRSSN